LAIATQPSVVAEVGILIAATIASSLEAPAEVEFISPLANVLVV
jgi:hypothetical protein